VSILRLALLAALVLFLLPLSSPAQSAVPQQTEPGGPLKLPANASPYTPITRQERLKWFVNASIGPESVFVGLANSAYDTGLDDPHEYRGTWSGFGKRFAVRESSVSLGNAIEASLGSFWGEDPRYFRAPEKSFKGRVGDIIRQTFLARYPDGRSNLAYARYAGIVGSNFISNTWRAASESSTGDALTRVGWGFLSRMGVNAFDEFWPDTKRRIFHHKH
jgi:hypothetical protein